MKRIIAILMTFAMLVGVMTAFAMTSHADSDTTVPTETIESTLSVPADSDYVFYAQTRTNRKDSGKKDVRILCVADQEWISSIPGFVVSFTFTNGTTPVTLKSVGLSNVFKEITAYGTDGKIEIYTAAEGAVIFGWIITEVEADYADVSTNVPTATVVSDGSVEPELNVGADYDSPVEIKNDINVVTDGVYKDVSISNSGNNVKVGGIDHSTSKATYIVSGNYEGFYDLTFYYTDMDGRRIGVVVNGDVYIITLPEKTESWDDVTKAKSTTITVKMKKGANVISFMRTDGYGPNLVDFDLKRNTTFGTLSGDSIVKAADDFVSSAGRVEDCTYGTKKMGWLNSDNSAVYSINVPESGKYMVKLPYLSEDQNRKFALTIDGGETTAIRVVRTDSYDDETVAKSAVVFLELTQGTHEFTIAGFEGNAPNLLGLELIKIAD